MSVIEIGYIFQAKELSHSKGENVMTGDNVSCVSKHPFLGIGLLKRRLILDD